MDDAGDPCQLDVNGKSCVVNSGGCTYNPYNPSQEKKCDPLPVAVPLIIFCVVVQALALLYYIFSYIPYGRTLLRKCGKRCFAKCAGV